MIPSLRARRLIVMALALTAALLAVVVPAQADDPPPIPTTVRLFYAAAPQSSQTTLVAHVLSDSGIPTGTVQFFRNQDATPINAVPIPVDAKGYARLVTTLAFFESDHAVFTGSGNYANSTSLVDHGVELMYPEPTIARIGGPGTKLTLTMATYVRFKDGTPAEGETIQFSLLAPLVGASGHPGRNPLYVPGVRVCQATADANGYATCGGSSSVAAIVSILTLGAYANLGDSFGYYSEHVPVIVAGS